MQISVMVNYCINNGAKYLSSFEPYTTRIDRTIDMLRTI